MSSLRTLLSKVSTWLLTAFLFIMPAKVLAEGGFVGMQAGITDSQDMDSFGQAYRIYFGPNILENLALEFGLLDMGKAEYNDPKADTSSATTSEPPTFRNAGHGNVSRSPGSGDDLSTATFTGISSAHPKGFLITFRYKFGITDDIDFFVKTGANIWQAELENIELTVDQSGNQTKQTFTGKKASAVDQISGGGFLWRPVKQLAVRAELETTALDSIDFERVRFQMITLGAQYEF